MKRIALAQYPILRHENLETWNHSVRNWVREAREYGRADLLVFPEYGSLELVSLVPNYENLSLDQQIEGLMGLLDSFKTTYADLSREYGVTIVSPSVPIPTSRGIENHAFVFSKSGKISSQSKWHMTRFEDEIWGVRSGENLVRVFQDDGFKFGIQICFDNEFPTGTHALVRQGIDLLVSPSCTETKRGLNRVHIGARARALENQILVGVSQTVGDAAWCSAVDQNTGKAALYASPDKFSPEDGIVAEGMENQVGWVYSDLDFSVMEKTRKRGSVFNLRGMERELMHELPFQTEIVDLR